MISPTLRRHAAVLLAASMFVAALLALSLTAPHADAARTPSVTIVMVCDRGVPPTWDGSLRGIYNISFQAANGTAVGFGPNMECPAAGGRVRTRVTTSAPAASASFSCWNGTILVGSSSGPLPLTGDCVDAGVHYAKVTIR